MSEKVGEGRYVVRPDTKGFESSIGKVAKRAAGVFAAAFAGTQAIQFFKGTIDAASDLDESMNKVDVVFGDSAAAVQKFAKSSAKSLGQSRVQALAATGTFGNLFRSLKLTEKQSANMSTSLVGLASDMASFNNVDPQEALDALRAGLVGETEPLKRFGVNMNEATLKAKAMALGLADGKKPLDANVKAQAAYALILEQTSLAQGDFARTSTGLANSQRIAAARFEDTKARIGKAFLPIMTSAAQFLIKTGIPAFERLAIGMIDVAKEVIAGSRAFRAFVDESRPAQIILQVIGAALGGILAVFVAGKIVRQMRDFGTAISNIPTKINNSQVIKDLKAIGTAAENASKKVANAAAKAAEKGAGGAKAGSKAAGGFVSGFAGAVGGALATVAIAIVTAIAAALTLPVWVVALGIAAIAAATAFVVKFREPIFDFFKSLPGTIGGFLSELPGIVQRFLGRLPAIFGRLAGLAGKAFLSSIDFMLARAIDLFITFPLIIATKIITGLPGIIAAVAKVGAGILAGLVLLISKIPGWALKLNAALINGLTSIIAFLVPAALRLGVSIITGIASFIPQIPGIIARGVVALVTNLPQISLAIVTFLTTLPGIFVRFFQRAFTLVIGAVAAFGRTLASFLPEQTRAALNRAREAFDKFRESVGNIFQKIIDFVKGVPGKISGAAGGMFDGIKNAFRSAINFIIRAWNKLEFKIPGFDPPGPGPKFKGFTLGTPHINEFHQGGVVPGRSGQEVLGLLQAGERVLTKAQQAAGAGNTYQLGIHTTAVAIDRTDVMLAFREMELLAGA